MNWTLPTVSFLFLFYPSLNYLKKNLREVDVRSGSFPSASLLLLLCYPDRPVAVGNGKPLE